MIRKFRKEPNRAHKGYPVPERKIKQVLKYPRAGIGEKEMLRECTVDGKRVYFHQWNTHKNVVEASPFIGGAPAGQIEYTVALVEYEDGSVAEVAPSRIKFADRPDESCDVANKQTWTPCARMRCHSRKYRCSKSGI